MKNFQCKFFFIAFTLYLVLQIFAVLVVVLALPILSALSLWTFCYFHFVLSVLQFSPCFVNPSEGYGLFNWSSESCAGHNFVLISSRRGHAVTVSFDNNFIYSIYLRFLWLPRFHLTRNPGMPNHGWGCVRSRGKIAHDKETYGHLVVEPYAYLIAVCIISLGGISYCYSLTFSYW